MKKLYAASTLCILCWFVCEGIEISEPNLDHQIFSSEALHNKTKQSLLNALVTLLPPFAIINNNLDHTDCQMDSYKYLEALKSFELWALKMHDSSAKIPSGLLNGNVNQYGDFDQCLESRSQDHQIQGKYCLSYIQIIMNKNLIDKNVLEIYELVQSKSVFRSKISDPGHRIPRFSSINWALCVPHSCSAQQVEAELKQRTNDYFNMSGINFEVKVENEMCQTSSNLKLSVGFVVTCCIFVLMLLITIIATVRDLLIKDCHEEMTLLSCYSIKRNIKVFLNTEKIKEEIDGVDFVRVINAIMLLISHKSMAVFYNPYVNRTYMSDQLSQPWTVVARAASLYTDPFIMLSGLITAYSTLNRFQTKSYNWFKEIVNRLIRIVPSYLAVIMFCTFVLPQLNSGPQWSLTVTHHSKLCQSSWWKNLLFIHNYFGFENMCLTHTHHLGIDFQLFLISPVLIWMIYKWKQNGINLLIAVAAISTGLRYYTTIQKELSYFVYPGVSVEQMFRTANSSYILPTHRISVYIIGLLLGKLLHHCGQNYKIKRHVNTLGWAIFLSMMYYSFIKLNFMSDIKYKYNKYDAGLYSALSPIGWCMFFAWVIFTTHTNNAGFIGTIISSKYFKLVSKISYSLYLIQFPIFFYNVGIRRAPLEYSFLLMLNIDEYICIFSGSILLTILIQQPIQNMKSMFTKNKISCK